MVRFEKDRYIIEVYTGGGTVECWMNLHESLSDLIRNVNADNITDNFYAVGSFLGELLPQWEVARKMED